VYCGGSQCPSISLPVAPDGVGVLQETFTSVTVMNYRTGKYIVQVA
jgi:hypothetical protein